ncbi:PDDEXK nuclease domain-containing protein [Methylomonas rosea]|uniref:PDDEXK nuclease domain-containing protein n=1 Tax=Methylomonas rosea TaxID=2952227 RepID=A0ABT1TMT5_9GAMM|nr:PDDEXK nuclease domain-containing protein [Methylomonas sp. WSC-7]MCQ8116082.1 PDDEXK nuclease domain-containing protein [Methylomonas sp. WSC-7]
MTPLFIEIRQLIVEARSRVAVTVNAELTLLYWQIGSRINTEILQGQRAEYGKQIVATLAQQLTDEYGKGWGVRHLRDCLRFAEAFPDEQIVHTLCAELSWSHLRLLAGVDDALKREFYIEVGRQERWSVRQLQERMGSMLFERTAISKKPEQTIAQELNKLRQEGQVSADMAFRDPYVLDFLGLADSYSEKDLESSILAELQRFIIELGNDFAFMARQKRITIDNRDYRIDLLFFHRRLKCLVAIDLKIGEFEAAFKGQMELYLRYLEKYEQMEGENSPIGLILCTGKNDEHVELMRLDQSNIRVAEYLTVLPPRETLQAKLHQSILIARQRLMNKEEE